MVKGGSVASGKESEGIDALRVLQIGGGMICAVALVWAILHYVLHVI